MRSNKMAKKIPSVNKLRKVDLLKPRNDVATWCEGCGEILTHVHLCPNCMGLLATDPEIPDAE